MSEEQVEIVRAHLGAFRSLQDAPRTVSFFDPHVVLDLSRTGGDQDAIYGPEAIAEFMRHWIGAFADYRWEIERLADLGPGAVLAVSRETGRGRGSGVPVSRTFAVLYTVIDGKIARATVFRSEQDALEAAGLSE
jgi:ketosteroid isomerase-like protein